MQTIIVNGKKYTTDGGSISVRNNKVYVNGKLISDENDTKDKVINITIEGDVKGNVESDCGNINVKGNARDIKTSSGEINIDGPVAGNISATSGDIEINGYVIGNVTSSSGDINVKGSITGDTKTSSGDIKEENRGAFRKTILDLI